MPVVLADGEDRDDVGVMELGGGVGLALEALAGLSRQAEAGGQDLEGNAAIQRDLPGLVDDAHAAATDLADELEVAESPERRGSEVPLGAAASLGLV